MGRDIQLNDEVAEYLEAIQPPEPNLLQRLREETARLGEISAMQIGWVQGRFMQALAKAASAKTYLEVGTFTGYSALAMALALPEDGRVITLDINEEWTGMAQRYWREAGLDHKIDLKLGEAGDTLAAFAKSDLSGRLDMMFIDADKVGMPAYFDAAMELLRPGGIVLVDNVLWSGDVVDPEKRDKDTEAIRAFNRRMAGEAGAVISVVPVGDGLTIGVKI